MKRKYYMMVGKWRLWWNLCPLCNSDAPELYDCPVCLGECQANHSWPPDPKTKALWLDRYTKIIYP